MNEMNANYADEWNTSSIVAQKIHLDFYYCPQCHHIPIETIDKNFSVLIQCSKCSRKYCVTLQQFSDEIKKDKIEPQCFKSMSHGPIKTETFCTECNKWYCNQCIINHEEMMNDHITLISDGLEMSSKCQERDCKNATCFYCSGCNKHICALCKDKYHKIHSDIFEINSMINDKKFSEVKMEIDCYVSRLNKEIKQMKDFINTMPSGPNKDKCNKYLEEKECEGNLIITFLNNLLNAYNVTKRVPTFNPRQNLIKVKESIEEIEKYKLSKVREIKDYISGSPMIAFFLQLLDNSFQSYFEVKEKGLNVDIFDNEFSELNDSNCTMFIDDIKTPFCKTFQFEREGKHKINIIINPGNKIKDLQYIFRYSPIFSFNSLLDTSEVTNMHGTFFRCKKLKMADLSNFNTSKVTDVSWLFKQCSSLEQIKFGPLDLSNVLDMNEMLKECSKLMFIDLSEIKLGKVVNLSCLFYGCVSLEEITLGSLDFSSVTDIHAMFYQCEKLRKIDLSNLDTKNVKDMNSLFSDCKELREVKLLNFNTENVTDMSSMFFNCQNISILDLSSFKTQNVQNFERMFKGCLNLRNVIKSPDFVVKPNANIKHWHMPEDKGCYCY